MHVDYLHNEWMLNVNGNNPCGFIYQDHLRKKTAKKKMILDHHQFAYRLFNIIRSNGDIYDIKKLLVKISKINLNYLNYDGQSLAHLCCLHNRLDLLKLFVERGHCDVYMSNRDGWLPLHIAVYRGYVDIVDYLLRY